MRPHPLRARSVAIVAPHPDDEAIGAFGLMWRLRARGARLRVIVVSDGAASHPGSRRWPPRRLTRERKRETRRAMALLGVRPSALRFLDLADGALTRSPALLDRTIGRALRRGFQPECVVGPASNDAHPDHRAVAASLARVVRGRRRLTYRVWPEPAGGGRGLAVPLAPTALRAKRRAVRGYATQTGRITDSSTGCTLTWRHMCAFVRPTEHFAWVA